MEPLQPFDYKEDPYERPNSKWRCGRLREGMPCGNGPDPKGRCQGGFECQPVNKGYRWYCTRPAEQGGPCSDGPLPEGGCSRSIKPCEPVSSIRYRRTRFAIWITALTAAISLMCLNANHVREFVSPGPLSSHHSAIVEECSDCHEAAKDGFFSWMGLAIQPSSVQQEADKCISCHPRGDSPLNHHGLRLDRLNALTEKAERREGNVPTPGPLSPRHQEQNVSCHLCHSEHEGKNVSLTHMANQRCQACHVVRYPGLSEGHPEFESYPYERRTQLNFDHVSHFNLHFEDKKDLAPESCGDCHRPGESGLYMHLKDFQTTCSSCHDDDVHARGMAGSSGFAVLAVPALDGESLLESEVHVGAWPRFSDGQLTPFLKLLLLTNQGLRTDLEALDEWDLDDLYDAEDETREAAGRVANGIKLLIHELANGGHPALVSRLEKLLGRTLTEEEQTGLAGLLPGTALKQAAATWWPDLDADVVAIRAGKPLETDLVRRPKPKPKQAPKPKPKPKPTSGDILSGSDDILGGDDILSGDDDVLGGDDILGGDDDILGGDGILGSNKPEEKPAEPEPVIVDAQTWNALGGWFLDGDVLRYRPSGHEDRFLKAWLDLTASYGQMDNAAAAEQLFKNLSSERTPGKCMTCHTADQTTEGSLKVNWSYYQPNESRQEFTRFSHASHFALMSKDGCSVCHVLDPKADYAASFDDHDPSVFASNFKAMKLDQCADCHHPEGSGDNCLTCHNYHVGEFPAEGLHKARIDKGGAAQ